MWILSGATFVAAAAFSGGEAYKCSSISAILDRKQDHTYFEHFTYHITHQMSYIPICVMYQIKSFVYRITFVENTPLAREQLNGVRPRSSKRLMILLKQDNCRP